PCANGRNTADIYVFAVLYVFPCKSVAPAKESIASITCSIDWMISICIVFELLVLLSVSARYMFKLILPPPFPTLFDACYITSLPYQIMDAFLLVSIFYQLLK